MGVHIIAEFFGCPRKLLKEVKVVKKILFDVVRESGLNKVGSRFHQFEPHGVTGVIILSESHISVHTWPERRLVALDIFTCGKEGNAKKAFQIFSRYVKPKWIKKNVIMRNIGK